MPTLELARAIAQEEGLHYAYIANVPEHPGKHTYCPECGEELTSGGVCPQLFCPVMHATSEGIRVRSTLFAPVFVLLVIGVIATGIWLIWF